MGIDRTEQGFSLPELAVVVAVTLILMAIGVPGLLNATYTWRINGAAADVSGLVQQARILAEKQNTTIPVLAGTVETNAQGAFIGTSGSTWSTGEPDVPYGGGVSNGSASNAPSGLNPGFTPESAGTVLYFNSRGLPVKLSGATYIPSNGVIFYLTDVHNDWAAVSVTGSGRSKVWMYTGHWH